MRFFVVSFVTGVWYHRGTALAQRGAEDGSSSEGSKCLILGELDPD